MAEKMFVEMQLPKQTWEGGHLFPAVLCPNQQLDACRFIEELKHHKAWLEDVVLKRSGAILLRGFPVETALDFNAVIEAFGYVEMAYLGGTATRTNFLGRVYTANECPPAKKIPFHHEMAHVLIPTLLWRRRMVKRFKRLNQLTNLSGEPEMATEPSELA